MRLGSQSLQSEEGVVFADRDRVTYLCEQCEHETTMVFASDAEVPDQWECKKCAHLAVRLVDATPVTIDRSGEKIQRSHWDMLLERRSVAELEELLQERLDALRARRGQHKIGA